jgi:hypothetical protein
MRLVLANRHLIAAGGTEVHVVTVGEHLQRLGHEVVLYAPELGPFADHARRRGLEVSDTLRDIGHCDVVFAQDAIVVYELAERYPSALTVFRVCGDVFDFQLPPQLDGVVDLVVALSDRYERLAASCATKAPLLRLRMPIDVDRLVPLGALGERPRRAVLLGNYMERKALVGEVWGGLGLEVTQVGGDTQSYDVAAALADADIVVAKGRAALDAMACGRAVYVFDAFGGDGWVTPESYPALEADNFAGQATARVIDAASLAADLDGYRPQMGTVNRDLVLQHHSTRDHVVALLGALADRETQPRSPAPLRELARLVALQWSWELTAREFRGMHWPLREHAARSEHAATAAAEAARTATEAARAATERAAAGNLRAAEAVRMSEERAELLSAQRDEVSARASALEAQLAGERLAREAEAGALRRELATIRSTRAWRLAALWWRAKGRLIGGPRSADRVRPADDPTADVPRPRTQLDELHRVADGDRAGLDDPRVERDLAVEAGVDRPQHVDVAVAAVGIDRRDDAATANLEDPDLRVADS